MARHLTTLDAGFLQIEDADAHVSLAIGGVAVLDGPMPPFEEIRETVGSRCLSNPRSTEVLRTHTLDSAAPEWAPDPGFDLNHHLRRAALPDPGDDAALFAEIATIMERRLDRDRPLWECWVIEGLAGGRWALLIKVHHALADGIAATHLLTALSDDHDVDSFAADIAGSRCPARPLPLSQPRPSLNPLDWLGDSLRFSTGLARAAVRTVTGAAEVAAGFLRPAAGSPLTGPVSDLRRYSATEVSLTEVKSVCDRFGVTVNDVALAAVAGSYRDALMRRGVTPRPDSLRTLVPVSVRPATRMAVSDNRVSLMLPFLPVDLEDPVTRLHAVHDRLTTAKSGGQRQAGGTLVWLSTRLVPFAVSAATVRLLSRLPQRGMVTVATNVPGPRRQLTVMGRDVVRLLPIPPIAVQLRTGVAMLSYADTLAFGLMADFDTAADIDDLADGISREVALLAAASAG